MAINQAVRGTISQRASQQLDGIPRGASVLRANTVIIHARRLAAALATYRDSLERDARREQRARHRIGF
jgi:hypothetical protein